MFVIYLILEFGGIVVKSVYADELELVGMTEGFSGKDPRKPLHRIEAGRCSANHTGIIIETYDLRTGSGAGDCFSNLQRITEGDYRNKFLQIKDQFLHQGLMCNADGHLGDDNTMHSDDMHV